MAEETGLRGFDLTAWGAVFGPAGLPKPIVDRLSSEITRIVTDPEFREKMQQIGVEIQSSTPEQLRQFVSQQLLVWGTKVKDAQIQPE